MASFILNIWLSYNTLISDDKYADPRMKDRFLMSSPGTVFTILASYLYFCLKAGPRFMEGRKPYQLKKTLLVYNFLQVLLSCYLVYEGAYVWSGLNLLCEPMDYSTSPEIMRGASAAWLYFIAKITELLDTVFFVLRKKYNQVSSVHLYHHTIMPAAVWFGLRYYKGGHCTLLGVINSFVHIFMYSYYLIAGLGPEYQKYLWWKKHLTALQLIQFVIIFVHNFIPLFTDCTYPKKLNFLILVFTGSFIYMFGQFYVQNYIKKSKENNIDKKH